MTTITRRLAAAAVVVLTLAAAGCGDDGDETATPDGDATESTAAADDGGDEAEEEASDGDDASGDSSSGSANPCQVITQEQWEVIFGAGVVKSDGSGGPDNCNVLTSGASPGHEVALSNLTASFETTFDEQVAAYAGCGEATVLDGVGDQAIVDTSCLAITGSAWAIVDDGGDILLVSLDVGEPSTADVAAVEATLTTITRDMVAAR